MLSLIEVQCPHCGARGQIMVPPVGAIIIGPCPQCSELVVVFCGHVLPLDKNIMEADDVHEKREHLLGVLTEFLQDRIYKLLTEEDDFSMSSQSELPDDTAVADAVESYERGADRDEQTQPISESELERFMDVDLKLLDNKAYFKSVFEEN